MLLYGQIVVLVLIWTCHVFFWLLFFLSTVKVSCLIFLRVDEHGGIMVTGLRVRGDGIAVCAAGGVSLAGIDVNVNVAVSAGCGPGRARWLARVRRHRMAVMRCGQHW